MARRRESVFDTLLVLPWWVAILFGVIGYLAIAFGLPLIWTDKMLAPAALAIRPVGLVWMFLCFLAAAGSALRSFFISRKFDRQQGLEDIRSLSWRQFESIVGEAFRRRGYCVIENAGAGADGGIDLVLRKDTQKFFVQCKQWKKRSVGVKAVRELFGVISAHEAAGGFFVTCGTYTSDARGFAATTGIELIDGQVLERMVEEVQNVEPYPESSTTHSRATTTWSNGSNEPSCPNCGSPMVGRTAKRGAKAGSSFWGCSQYPRCRGTRAI